MWSEGETPLYLDRGYNPSMEDYSSAVHPDILYDIWRDIQLEYTELMDDGNLLRTITTAIKVQQYRIKFDLANACIAYLAVYYDPDTVKVLKELGLELTSDPSNIEKYLLELSRLRTLAKEFEIEMEMLQAELDSGNKGQENGDTSDEWTDIFLALEDDTAFKIRPEDMTVYEYTRRVKRYLKKLKQRAQQAKKGHNNKLNGFT